MAPSQDLFRPVTKQGCALSNREMGSRRTLLFFFIPLLILNIGCGIGLLKIASKQSVIKEDYAQVNSIRNGLLSVDVWKTHLENIAAKKITHFQLTDAQEEAVREAVEKTINALIGEMDTLMQKPQKTLGGKVRKLAFKVFVDTEALTEQTPQYAQAVINEVKKPENLKKIKTLALNQIGEVQDQEASEHAQALKALLGKYGADTVDQFNTNAEQRLHEFDKKVAACTAIMLGSLALFLAAWWRFRHNASLHKPLYALSVAYAFILLISALALPMIDIDARIKTINFLLMGEHLDFTNQLLFYRSKSIMQMVTILIVDGKPQTMLVGFLILLFSIIFPITKLSATLVSLYGKEKWRRHPVTHFFAFESGKWSMADVMVVAIFMAYIGFNGVLNGQLKHLNFHSETIGAIATNQTALQPGFALFVTFVLFSLVLSSILKRIVRRD